MNTTKDPSITSQHCTLRYTTQTGVHPAFTVISQTALHGALELHEMWQLTPSLPAAPTSLNKIDEYWVECNEISFPVQLPRVFKTLTVTVNFSRMIVVVAVMVGIMVTLFSSFIWPYNTFCLLLFFKNFWRFYLFIFRERGRQGEREGEKHQCVVASHAPPSRDLAQNPGVCPDWESIQWPFGSQAGAQCTEPHQPGLSGFFDRIPIYGIY